MLSNNTKNFLDRLWSRIAVVPPLRTMLVLVFWGDLKELQDVHMQDPGKVGKAYQDLPRALDNVMVPSDMSKADDYIRRS
jgi:hypothetical protein